MLAHSQRIRINILVYLNSYITISHTLRKSTYVNNSTHILLPWDNIQEKIPQTHVDPTTNINRSFSNSFMFRGILPNEVQELIDNLNVNKSSIGTPIQCITTASNIISGPLAYIFNLSLTQGLVPELLKVSKVTPVSKGGNALDPTNYDQYQLYRQFRKTSL